MWRLGWFYCTGTSSDKQPAMLAWERTGPGRSIARYLRHGLANDQMAYPLNRMYRRHDPSAARMAPDASFGVQTSPQTKPAMMGEWRRALREGEVQLLPEDLMEVETLMMEDNGRVNTNGRDRVMASVMACFAAQFVPIIFAQHDAPGKVQAREGSAAWARQAAQEERDRMGDDMAEEIL